MAIVIVVACISQVFILLDEGNPRVDYIDDDDFGTFSPEPEEVKPVTRKQPNPSPPTAVVKPEPPPAPPVVKERMPMNKAQQILKRTQELFFASLEEKTGWGRNDIKEKYNEAMNQAILEALDE